MKCENPRHLGVDPDSDAGERSVYRKSDLTRNATERQISAT